MTTDIAQEQGVRLAHRQHLGRWLLDNIELVLTAAGLGVILLSGLVASYSAVSVAVATAVSATVVGIIHGLLFWLVRRRQRQVRREAISQIREMLEDLGKNRLQTIKMSLYMVQLRQPELEQADKVKASFERVYQILAEISGLIDHISEESLAGWRQRYRQTLQRVEGESSKAGGDPG